MSETLLPKKLALPVFCSDPLSSNAYATEEILLMLSLGGVALLDLTPVGRRRRGAAARRRGPVLPADLPRLPERRRGVRRQPRQPRAQRRLVAASALLVDYVLTVAVSVAAGVANIVSAVPALAPYAVSLSLGWWRVLALMNLRGVKESGSVFAIPTYGFVACVFVDAGAGALPRGHRARRRSRSPRRSGSTPSRARVGCCWSGWCCGRSPPAVRR